MIIQLRFTSSPMLSVFCHGILYLIKFELDGSARFRSLILIHKSKGKCWRMTVNTQTGEAYYFRS